MALSVLQIHTKRYQNHKLEVELQVTEHQLQVKEVQDQDLIILVQFHPI